MKLKEILKKKEPKKEITYMLIALRIFVFAAFLYASIIMFKLNREVEGIILLFAIALWIILNKMEGG